MKIVTKKQHQMSLNRKKNISKNGVSITQIYLHINFLSNFKGGEISRKAIEFHFLSWIEDCIS